jgi:hypothetical protein
MLSIAGLAGCGGNSSFLNAHPAAKATATPTPLPTPTPSPAPTPTPLVQAIKLVPQGPGLRQGVASQFFLSVSALDAQQQPIISGFTFPAITLLSNVLAFTITPATITQNGTTVVVKYDGTTLPGSSGTGGNGTISASNGYIFASLGLTTPGATETAGISAITLDAPGATSIIDTINGSAIVNVVAYDGNNTELLGTYPTPVYLTSNNTAVGFTTGGLQAFPVTAGQTEVPIIYTYVSSGSPFHGTVVTGSTHNVVPTVTVELTL